MLSAVQEHMAWIVSDLMWQQLSRVYYREQSRLQYMRWKHLCCLFFKEIYGATFANKLLEFVVAVKTDELCFYNSSKNFGSVWKRSFDLEHHAT